MNDDPDRGPNRPAEALSTVGQAACVASLLTIGGFFLSGPPWWIYYGAWLVVFVAALLLLRSRHALTDQQIRDRWDEQHPKT